MRSESGPRRVRGQPTLPLTDQHRVHRPRHGAATPQRVALAEGCRAGLDELAATGRGVTAQSGKVVGQTGDLDRVDGPGSMPGVTHLCRDPGGESDGSCADLRAVEARLESRLLPFRVADPGGVA